MIASPVEVRRQGDVGNWISPVLKASLRDFPFAGEHMLSPKKVVPFWDVFEQQPKEPPEKNVQIALLLQMSAHMAFVLFKKRERNIPINAPRTEKLLDDVFEKEFRVDWCNTGFFVDPSLMDCVIPCQKLRQWRFGVSPEQTPRLPQANQLHKSSQQL